MWPSAAYFVTISASSAITPCPFGNAISGLTSISSISGTVRISRPIVDATFATASTSTAGAPRNGAEQLRRLELVQFLHDRRFREFRRQQPHVTECFDHDAAETDQHHRSPLRIALGADHQFQTLLRHFLDQHPIKFEARLMLLDVVVQLLPCRTHARFIGDVEQHATGFRLMRELRRLRLHCHREAYLLRRRDSFIRGLCQCAIGDLDACRGEHLLAEPLRLRSAAELRQVRDRQCRRRILRRCNGAAVCG